MNIKVAAFIVSEKSINIQLDELLYNEPSHKASTRIKMSI